MLQAPSSTDGYERRSYRPWLFFGDIRWRKEIEKIVKGQSAKDASIIWLLSTYSYWIILIYHSQHKHYFEWTWPPSTATCVSTCIDESYQSDFWFVMMCTSIPLVSNATTQSARFFERHRPSAVEFAKGPRAIGGRKSDLSHIGDWRRMPLGDFPTCQNFAKESLGLGKDGLLDQKEEAMADRRCVLCGHALCTCSD